ncbi:PEPxxWA-CTERM sorting domain-containing protein [Sphingomonas bacterium]|uniref:PEPxxWA-CTERM sorting domain-containing protein n=1 Tax=Sphingomonas bacterium TaxID=1895847 RepID=UPI00157691FD|nr:PEPxxWA-CTERM sorting domain-containing protein [Sphingomonas bacterium]
MNAKTIALIATVTAAGFVPAIAGAQTFYTGDASRTQFATATLGGAITTEGFEGITTPTSNGIGNVPEGTTFSRNGLSITGSFSNLNVLDNTYVNGGNQIKNRFGAATGSVLDDNFGNLTFTFAAPVNSFALDLSTIARGFVGASSGAFVLTINGISNTYNYSGTTGFGFLGYTSPTLFSSATITTSKTFDSELDNVQFGTIASSIAAATPEPGTWLMMIVGFGLAGFALRSAKRRSDVKFTAGINGIASGSIA